MTLSIIIPCYNEMATLPSLLDKVRKVNLGEVKKEIIVVDDGSQPATRDWLKRSADGWGIQVIFHEKNQGKGAAIRTGLAYATGDFVLIQDADLEYDPEDYPKLLEPLIAKKARVVYGSRERNPKNKRHSGILFYWGGLFLSWFTNLLYGSKLTDEATCYKVFERDLLNSFSLKCSRFEFCPEVTAKTLKRGIPIVEVPISYYPRTTKEGKKIRFRDGLQAIWTLVRYRFVD